MHPPGASPKTHGSRQSGRRNRSRQREGILAQLRASALHPTAAELHEALRPELPNLSLGTVYRNLDLLVAEGAVKTLHSASGGLRYDGNEAPHSHFLCEGCDAVIDVPLATPRGMTRRLEREHGLSAARVAIDFFGLCPACRGGSASAVPDSSGPSNRPQSGGETDRCRS